MVILATQTLGAIKKAIEKDQGASFRENLGKVIPHMGDAFRGAGDGFRSHLGASLLGGDCGRALWYGFHWTKAGNFDARILRLFNRGHLEEARFIAMLLAIGCDVYQQDEQGRQFRISDVGGHLGGSGDGIAVGVPDVPAGQPVLAEFKTHNDKSFKKLVSEGVREAKFGHYVQMNLYMYKMGIPLALYMAVNKNDDDIYAEILQLDTITAERFLERGRVIILSKEPPAKINESPGWYRCKWCDYSDVCHKDVTPDINCRTCQHSEARDTGEWVCNLNAPQVLTTETQIAGCAAYARGY